MIEKKNIPLVIALAVPLLMILLIAGFVYLPGIGKSPAYNFLYLSNASSYYGYANEYYVRDGQLQYQASPKPYYETDPYYQKPQPTPSFYVYDVKQKKATEVSLSEAQSYRLESSNESPDGYKIERGNYSGDVFFGGGNDYSNWYIKGHNRSVKLNVRLNGQDYYNFQFLGWIMN